MQVHIDPKDARRAHIQHPLEVFHSSPTSFLVFFLILFLSSSRSPASKDQGRLFTSWSASTFYRFTTQIALAGLLFSLVVL